MVHGDGERSPQGDPRASAEAGRRGPSMAPVAGLHRPVVLVDAVLLVVLRRCSGLGYLFFPTA